jgi:predicted nucleotidyltransferase component of viral defense system
MDKNLAEQFSKELKININQIAREYWEMLILKELAESSLGEKLIFIGGTALRLVYNSPRFSDDLDFYLKKKISFDDFKKIIKDIAKKYNLEISDLQNKKFTFLAEFKIKEDFLTLPFSLKIEIRKKILKKGFELRLLNSPISNFNVLLFVLDLKTIKKFKISAFKNRKEPRDLFDLWFISQKLKERFKKPKIKIDKKIIKQTLNKYLPVNYHKIIDDLIK